MTIPRNGEIRVIQFFEDVPLDDGTVIKMYHKYNIEQWWDGRWIEVPITYVECEHTDEETKQ